MAIWRVIEQAAHSSTVHPSAAVTSRLPLKWGYFKMVRGMSLSSEAKIALWDLAASERGSNNARLGSEHMGDLD